jgi:hypothetical protein
LHLIFSITFSSFPVNKFMSFTIYFNQEQLLLQMTMPFLNCFFKMTKVWQKYKFELYLDPTHSLWVDLFSFQSQLISSFYFPWYFMGLCFFYYVVICNFGFVSILNRIQSCFGYVNWNKFSNNRNEICVLVLPIFKQQKLNRTETNRFELVSVFNFKK